ncbi:ATP-binding protein, partial [Candidatus Woesearchaeota archaeon]|nr:ATP-binding protein [Candidatus Woesearchaeota archaeon]
MIQTNWYVLTGGPSSGKSKTLEYIAFLGHFIVPEASRILIDNNLSKGKSVEETRADEAEFQRIGLQMQIEVEDRIPEDRLTFFERGIPDCIAYYEVCGIDTAPVLEASKLRRYKRIFYFEPLPFERDYARTEGEETVRKLNKSLYDSYADLSYE